MPFDKKIACLTNYQERQSFPWPLVNYSCKNKKSWGSGHICVSTAEIFGVVRSLMAFRLTGGGKDFLIVGSDSGRIAILEYNASKNTLERVHMETFGKSGCRRIVPGQYLAIDPKGRAGRSWTLHSCSDFFATPRIRSNICTITLYKIVLFQLWSAPWKSKSWFIFSTGTPRHVLPSRLLLKLTNPPPWSTTW